MFWPFKRKKKKPADIWERAGERMIRQGMHPGDVKRAVAMAQRFARMGAIPEGLVREDDPGPEDERPAPQ